MKQVILLTLTLFTIATAEYPEAKDSVLLQAKVTKHEEKDNELLQDRCACENPGHGTFASCTSSRNCNCNGRVRMGYGNRWTSWRDVSGSIQCTNGAFGGDPAPGQAKECQCDGYELLRSGSCPANRQVSQSDCVAAARAVGANRNSLDGGAPGGLNGRPSGCTLHEWGNVEWWGQSDNANCGSLNYNCVCRTGPDQAGFSVGDRVVIDGDTAWITQVMGGGQFIVDYRDGHTSYEQVSESEMSPALLQDNEERTEGRRRSTGGRSRSTAGRRRRA